MSFANSKTNALLAKAFHRIRQREREDAKYKPVEDAILALLACGPKTRGFLGDRLVVDGPAAVNKALKRLAARGLVRAEVGPVANRRLGRTWAAVTGDRTT